ncbi:hypothetical protein A6V36_34420 [Paraburkholderia ginsengiterrae]|uniref:Tox-REase-5 domain-containing protein n=1 Tax=Paraburkholderia ginsengiterrae TaxID=1462993 RepID=A0A1A9N2U3_9BURK|nr:Tox-REase-5 domain-containing protein [Paraburkholderia ginsengiterrae]OAJ55263.1 hypothetical protein A6V37_33375 [Paraburkholderia ginsengiterrae]OAJ55641.1 hypothetical protein A6V36_34420 [Paraburkholderia ginsengiterrae]
MAVIVAPAAEGLGALVIRILVALGVGVELSEQATSLSKDKVSDCAESGNQSQCNQCRLQEGFVGQALQPRYVTRGNRINYDYQLYIGNLHAGPERFSYVKRGDNANTEIDLGWQMTKDMFGNGGIYTTTEWSYGGVWFDGFWRSMCTVVEAKANFEDLWNERGNLAKPWGLGIVTGWVSKDYPRQQAAIANTAPQGKLEWHFMQRLPYAKAVETGLPKTVARLTPMPILGL